MLSDFRFELHGCGLPARYTYSRGVYFDVEARNGRFEVVMRGQDKARVGSKKSTAAGPCVQVWNDAAGQYRRFVLAVTDDRAIAESIVSELIEFYNDAKIRPLVERMARLSDEARQVLSLITTPVGTECPNGPARSFHSTIGPREEKRRAAVMVEAKRLRADRLVSVDTTINDALHGLQQLKRALNQAIAAGQCDIPVHVLEAISAAFPELAGDVRKIMALSPAPVVEWLSVDATAAREGDALSSVGAVERFITDGGAMTLEISEDGKQNAMSYRNDKMKRGRAVDKIMRASRHDRAPRAYFDTRSDRSRRINQQADALRQAAMAMIAA